MKVVAIIPVRKGSQRVKNKNFKNFFDGRCLLELKIDQLKKVKYINEIVVSSNSNEAKKIAKTKKVTFHQREEYYASSACSGSEFYKNLAESIKGDYLVYAPCTAPIIKSETYENFFQSFLLSKDKFDSFNTVKMITSHIWVKNKPLNYNPLNAPNSQDLPKDICSLTYGINIISKNNMIKFQNIVGKKPNFFPLDDLECTDIDTNLDFNIASYLYKDFAKK